jgi:hypothetical protein
VPVLPVGAAGFHHPHAAFREVPGQAGAVAAGAPDVGRGDVAELREPAQEAGVPGCAGGELPCPQQAADGVEGGGDAHLAVGASAAGDGLVLF